MRHVGANPANKIDKRQILSSIFSLFSIRRALMSLLLVALSACGGGGLDSLPVDQNNLALVVSFDGGMEGTVTSSPAGIDCKASGGACGNTFPVGTQVTLSAQPASGATFSGWAGACSGTGPCVVTMSSNMAVSAIFGTVPNGTYDFGVVFSGSGSVSLATSAGTDSCATTCQRTFPSGTTVTLTATPAAGSIFSSWSGACTGSGPCTITMDQARLVTATFVPVYSLNLTVNGSGSVLLDSSAGAITCTASCGKAYVGGTVVTLTATPAAGQVFNGWSGACSGTGVCTTTMTAAKAVTAAFVPTYDLGLTVSGTGSVALVAAGVTDVCSSSCVKTYKSGTSVTLTATPGSGQAFGGWSGACSGTAACTTTMSAAKAVTATFVPAVNLSLSLSGSGSVAFVGGGSSISCTATCSNAYASG
jgi:Divergent InlB B-repeat domain